MVYNNNNKMVYRYLLHT